MKYSVVCLAALALLSSKVRSNEVEVAGDRATPTVDHLLQIVQLKLDELFVESSEQVEQLLTELYHLRQSVEHVAWLTNRVERAVQKVQLDNDVLVRNVSLLTSQTDNIILNQQYCANHEALKNLFFELTPKCLGNQTVPPTPTPSIATTTESAETLPTTTISEDPIVYERCSQAPSRSGVYRLRREDGTAFSAFCEQERFGGGLLVFQSRLDGSVDFNRSWSEFVEGFGDPAGEYWLGLETLHQVAPNATDLVVAMKNFSDVEAYEKYCGFWIDDASVNYRIRFTAEGNGTAGDSLYSYFSEQFMTYDHVSNGNYRDCIAQLGSGFWHYSCNSQIGRNNLNGIYGLGKGKQGIWWGTFGNLSVQNTSPLKSVQMMVRY
ncbi:ficolin-3-like [Culex pipiens pallens]|uniref:ficolin-3-like n=1 Tax=Culex pipiens pallens TaxID=42434 RepID=UPI0019540A0B|nr:ficolin-3-like [Culex pipiens pallens]